MKFLCSVLGCFQSQRSLVSQAITQQPSKPKPSRRRSNAAISHICTQFANELYMPSMAANLDAESGSCCRKDSYLRAGARTRTCTLLVSHYFNVFPRFLLFRKPVKPPPPQAPRAPRSRLACPSRSITTHALLDPCMHVATCHVHGYIMVAAGVHVGALLGMRHHAEMETMLECV